MLKVESVRFVPDVPERTTEIVDGGWGGWWRGGGRWRGGERVRGGGEIGGRGRGEKEAINKTSDWKKENIPNTSVGLFPADSTCNKVFVLLHFPPLVRQHVIEATSPVDTWSVCAAVLQRHTRGICFQSSCQLLVKTQTKSLSLKQK